MKKPAALILAAMLLCSCSAMAEPPQQPETNTEKPDSIVAFENNLESGKIVMLNLWGQQDIGYNSALYQEVWNAVYFSGWEEITSATATDSLLNMNFIAEDGAKLSVTLYGTDTAILISNGMQYRMPNGTYDKVMNLLLPYLGAETFTESEVLAAIQKPTAYDFAIRVTSDSIDGIVPDAKRMDLIESLNFTAWVFDNGVQQTIPKSNIGYRIHGDNELTVFFYPDLQCAVIAQNIRNCGYRLPAEVSDSLKAFLDNNVTSGW